MKTGFRFRIVFAVLMAGLGLANSLPAQKFERISLEHGLSHGSIYSIAQDLTGFIWFGSEDGLNRYDGYTITVIRHDPDNPDLLPTSDCSKMHVDGSGIMWIGTWGAGLVRYDPTAHVFRHFRHNPENPGTLSGDRIECIYRDTAGRLWVGTERSGLNRFDEANERFTRYRFDPENPTGLSSDWIKALWEDDKGRLWVGTNAGLNRLDPGAKGFVHFYRKPGESSGLGSNLIRSIIQDKNGTFWIGTREGGLNRFDPDTGHTKVYMKDPQNPGSISDDSITQVYEDSYGTLWVGTYYGGLNRFDPVTETFTHFKYDPRDTHSLSHNRVEVIFEDRAKILWIGTRGGGVNKLDLKPAKFVNYTYTPHESHGLPHPAVHAIAGDRDGEIAWIGTDGGLRRFDGPTGRFKEIRQPPDAAPHPVNGKRIRSVITDRNGNTWVGTYNAGLYKLIPSGGDRYRIINYTTDPTDPYSISSNRVRILLEDKDGDIWIGTVNGLNLLILSTAPSNSRFKRFTARDTKPGTLSSSFIISIYQDRGGTVWVGTDNGLNRTEKQRGHWSSFKHTPADPRSLSNNYVRCIFEAPGTASTGTLWIGTEVGLNQFDVKTHQSKRYTEKNGLPANRVSAISTDDRGNLWIATSRGISRFDPVSETSEHFDITNGLPGHGFNACFKDNKGRMYFGGVAGLTVFSPKSAVKNPFIPPVVITSIKLFNKELRFHKPLRDLGEISLPYNQRFIAFEFAALDYTYPAKNRYAYKMEGFDPGWVENGTRNHAAYTNLSPGNYVFHVKASNNDGVWNQKGISLKIDINPPFWLTWWFRISVLSVLGLSIFAAFRFRLRQIKKRNIELKTANFRLAEEINKRKMVEKALKQNKNRLFSVLNHASIILWAMDGDGIFTFSGGRGLQALGFQPGEVVGQSVFDVYAGHPGVIADAERALAGETFSTTANIEGHIYETRYSPLRDENGELAGTIGVATDETERKNAEAEKASLQEQLRHAQKLETIGTLAGGIAHDFNNILGPILGYTQMSLEEIPGDSITRDWLENVQKAAYRAKELVQQILVFGRRHAQEYKPVKIQVIAREALRLVRASLPTTIEIQHNINSECEPVLADPTQIHQVIVNLCTNAKHAMEETGGLLTIALEVVDVDEKIAAAYSNLQPGKYVCFTVSDTGLGMDTMTMERIFEPFYTTRDPGEGTGLGLSVVHGIVMGHEGEITVSSTPGQGSEFKVYLPAVAEAYETVEEPTKTGTIPGGTEHILLVDDEESMIVMGSVMLEQLGYRVTTFTDSVDALERFKEDPGSIDLVLTDQTMPHYTGTRLSDEMKRIRPDIPVIVMTGFSESIDTDNMEKYSFDAYLEKPFNTTSLATMVREILDTMIKING